MARMDEAAREFLAQRRIAVAGVSRSGEGAANLIYGKLRDTGHQVVPLNPNADEVEGDACYPDLAAVSGGVDGVVAVTSPEETERLVEQCIEAGVRRIWMHRSPMGSSVSARAVERCRENGIGVIAGGCPMMYQEPVDVGHRCIRWVGRLTGAVPNEADPPSGPTDGTRLESSRPAGTA